VEKDGLVANIPFYEDPGAESVLRMGPSGGALVLVSDSASVSVRLENVFDDQTSIGKNFAKVKFRGIKPAVIHVSFVVLPEEEAAFYKSVAPLFRQKGKNGNSPPMSMVNLQANRLGIDTVSIVSADVGAPDARNGRSVTLELKEWTAKPTAAAEVPAGVANKDPAQLQPEAIQANQ
jgi:hypothetical protein